MKQLFINIQEPIWNEIKIGMKKEVLESIKILLMNDFVIRLFDAKFNQILPDIDNVNSLEKLLN